MYFPKKCYCKLPGGRVELEAILIGMAQRASLPLAHNPLAGQSMEVIYTVDALVELQTFDKGRIYQLPFNLIRVVDQWDVKE